MNFSIFAFDVYPPQTKNFTALSSLAFEEREIQRKNIGSENFFLLDLKLDLIDWDI